MVPSVLHPCPEGYGNRSDADRGHVRDCHVEPSIAIRVVPCELNSALYCAQYGCRFPPPRRRTAPGQYSAFRPVATTASDQAVLCFRDEKRRSVATRLRPKSFRTPANGVLGLAEAEE